jgi:photosystem II stability/assembly factor-like uncharacterized protein
MKKLFVVILMLAAMNASGQWVMVSHPGIYVFCLANSGTNLFGGSYDNYISPYGSVNISTNNGTTWAQTSLNYAWVYSLLVSGSNIFAGIYGGGVYLSTNNGANWTAVNNGISSYNIKNLAISGTNLFAGGSGSRQIFLSTNNGTNWTVVNNNTPTATVLTFAVSGTNVFAGFGSDGGICLTTNYGTNWTSVNNGLTGLTVYSIAVIGTKLFATSYNQSNNVGYGVFMSTNNGTNWTAVNNNLPNLIVNTLAVSGTNLIAGSETGAYLSSNNGTNWIDINLGMPSGQSVDILYSTNNYLYAIYQATISSIMYRRPLSEILGIKSTGTETPSSYSLSQNYPNPFNPTTKIKFNVAKTGEVKITVFDVTGREVQTLVNESLKPGTYEAAFDGSQFTSGVYFYKITAGDFSETKKMLMIK